MAELEFRVRGKVRDHETGEAVAGVIVRAYDKDLLYDDLLGAVKTDESGEFELRYSGSDFEELFERHPDIYFKVLDDLGKRLLYASTEFIRWEGGADKVFELEFARELPPHMEAAEVALLDAQGNARETFEAGESLVVAAGGLRPEQSHRVTLLEEAGDEVASAWLTSDPSGVIAPTVLWPDIGIGDPEEGGPYAFATVEEAAAELGGRRFALEVTDGDRPVRRARVQLAAELAMPRLYSGSETGAPRRGLLEGEDELRVVGRNLPPGSLLDAYLVERQSDWRAGDPFVPVRDPDGSEVLASVQLEEGEDGFNITLWPRERVRPGRYDIVARVTGPHEWRRDERVFRATDLVSDRFLTSVVVRRDVYAVKPIWLGCINAIQIAGRRLAGSPYFEFTDNFPRGTDVWATLDPGGLMPNAIGKKIRYYVTQHKDATQWTNDPNAPDVTGGVHEVIVTSGCINGNESLVWPNPQQPGTYDLVVDFGNLAPNPANYTPDGSFNPPDDMIDGAIRVGFHVTDDPGAPGPFAVGQTDFNEPAVSIPATGVWAPPQFGGVLGNTPSGTLSLPLAAQVRYPATAAGVGTPVSNAKASYPVVVVMHGMHSAADPSYQGYTYLLDHLASHGYIALSIDCNAINSIGGMQDTRGHAILKHLSLLQAKNANAGIFQGKIDLTKIAIMGHSRGGDGVVQAEIFNQSQALGWNIKSVIALAPTDFSGISPSPLNLATSSFLCIYGSNDGDVWGGANPATQYTGTGFRFYDRAATEKAFVFVYGATHNRFNTIWGTEWKVDAGSLKILSAAQHELLLKGYMTAFLQAQLEGRAEQLDYLNGELKLPQAAGIDMHTQYRPRPTSVPPPLTLDSFETAPQVMQNSLGGTVTPANLDGAPAEGSLATLDAHAPHQTTGLRLKWSSTTATYASEIPLVGTQRNLTQYGFLNFRVSQTVGSAANLNGQLQDLYVLLKTAGGGPERAVRAGYFRTIPYPYKPEYKSSWDADEEPNTKAALKTVRIPLHAWAVKCLSAPIVDLSSVESVRFEFKATGSGELLIDDIEFTI